MTKFICDRSNVGDRINNFTDCCCISNKEAHNIFKEMEYEAKIQELEQKLKDMTENRDWWGAQCEEFYEDYKTLTDKLKKLLAQKEDEKE